MIRLATQRRQAPAVTAVKKVSDGCPDAPAVTDRSENMLSII